MREGRFACRQLAGSTRGPYCELICRSSPLCKHAEGNPAAQLGRHDRHIQPRSRPRLLDLVVLRLCGPKTFSIAGSRSVVVHKSLRASFEKDHTPAPSA